MANDFVGVIFAAIARQEGAYAAGNNIPKARNNPLDLRYAGQIGASCPRCGVNGGHVPATCAGQPYHAIAKFVTLSAGIAAGYRQLWADIAQGDSLRALIYSWAPTNENATDAYVANVQRWTGIADADAPLLNFLELGKPPEG
jgi:hypothetical protein